MMNMLYLKGGFKNKKSSHFDLSDKEHGKSSKKFEDTKLNHFALKHHLKKTMHKLNNN